MLLDLACIMGTGHVHAEASDVVGSAVRTAPSVRHRADQDSEPALRMSVLEQLMYFASLYGIPGATARREAIAWLQRFRIAEYADRKAETLWKGNQQKVQCIATVLHDPDVLRMDEPFAGLDPVNVALLKAAFLEMRDRGKTPSLPRSSASDATSRAGGRGSVVRG